MVASLLKIIFVLIFTMVMATVAIIVSLFDKTGKLFHSIAKTWAKVILKFCGIKVNVEGLDKVNFNRSYIYVANHLSQFDIPAVLAGIPDQIRIVYKKELEKIPFFGWGLKFGKTYIAINRGKGQEAIHSLEKAAQKIKIGNSVLLFGEGTRSPDGKLQQFKRGPFNLALKSGIPIVPVTINGSFKILPKHSMRIRPGTITLVLSPPIELPAEDGKESELILRDKVRSIIERNLKE